MATSLGGWFDKVFFDAHGNLCAGGELRFFQTGTDIPQGVATADGTSLGNVIRLDDDGRPESDFRFYTDKIYRVVIMSADGTRVKQIDNVAIPEGEGGAMYNPMTAEGDIIVGGTDGNAERLAKGNNGDALKIVNGVPKWTTDETGMANPMTSKGDIIVGSTDGAPARLAVGSNGDVLCSAEQSGATIPKWEAGTKKYRNVFNNVPSSSISDGYLGCLFYISGGNAQTINLPSQTSHPAKSFIDFVFLDDATTLTITPQDTTLLNEQGSSITIGGKSASLYRLTFLGRGNVGGVQKDQWAVGGSVLPDGKVIAATGDATRGTLNTKINPESPLTKDVETDIHGVKTLKLALELGNDEEVLTTEEDGLGNKSANWKLPSGKLKVTSADTALDYLANKLVQGTGITITTQTDGDGKQALVFSATGGGGGGSAGAPVWSVSPYISNTQQTAATDSWKTTVHKLFIPKLTPSRVAFVLSFDSSHFSFTTRIGIYTSSRQLCYYGDASFSSAPDYLGLNVQTGEFYSVSVSPVPTAPKENFENEFVLLAISFPSYGSYRPSFYSYNATNNSVRQMTAPITSATTTLPNPDGTQLTRTPVVCIM